MPSIASLACLLRSRRKFKAWKGGFYELQSNHNPNMVQKGQKGPPSKGGGERSHPKARTKTGRRGNKSTCTDTQTARAVGEDDSESPMASERSSLEAESTHGTFDPNRNWSVRRRDARVNGADLYVARFTKNGMGSAKPCWRCLEWSRWAGVKRIFHWNADENKFDVVKVNSEQREPYETHSDVRLFAGAVSYVPQSR